MRTIISLILGAALSIALVAPVAARAVYVPAHRTAKGAYVAPHIRAVPVVPVAPVYRGVPAYAHPYAHPYVAPYAGAVPGYGYQYPYAAGVVPGAPGYVPVPGYVPNVPAPVPVTPYNYGR